MTLEGKEGEQQDEEIPLIQLGMCPSGSKLSLTCLKPWLQLSMMEKKKRRKEAGKVGRKEGKRKEIPLQRLGDGMVLLHV